MVILLYYYDYNYYSLSKKTHLSMINARRERETYSAEAPRRNTRTIIHKHTHTLMNTYWRDADEAEGLRHHLRRCCVEWADRVSKGRGFWTNVKDATALPSRNDPSCRSPSPFAFRQTHASRESQCFLLREFRRKTETLDWYKQSNIAFLFEIEMENVDFVEWQWWWWWW